MEKLKLYTCESEEVETLQVRAVDFETAGEWAMNYIYGDSGTDTEFATIKITDPDGKSEVWEMRIETSVYATGERCGEP